MSAEFVGFDHKYVMQKRSVFFSFLFLSFVFFPSSLIPGGIRTGVALFSILFIVATLFLVRFRVGLIDFLLLLTSLSIFSSVVIAPGNVGFNEVVEVARPVFYLSTILFCRNYCRYLNLAMFANVLLFFIIAEFFVVVLQRLDVDVFVRLVSFIWNIDGNWEYRNTGTFSNPNILGGFLVFSWIGYAFLNGRGFVAEFILAGVVLFSLILSGSKTSIILFLLSIYFVYYLKYGFIRYLILSFFIVPLLLLVGYFWVVNNPDGNAYIIQILKIIEPGGLENIKSYSDRQNIWNSVISHYDDGGGVRFFLGYGPDKNMLLRSVDHEYIGIYYRYGFIGAALLYISIISYFIKLFSGFRLHEETRKIFHIVLVLSFILFVAGFVMESFSAWTYPFMLYIFVGIGLAKFDEHSNSRKKV